FGPPAVRPLWRRERTHRAYHSPVTLPSPRNAGRGKMVWAFLLIRPEPEQFRGIVRGDLAPVLLGHASEDAVEELLRLWPGRFGMREIAAPQHVVDADDVADLHAETVLHEFDKHVAPPILCW